MRTLAEIVNRCVSLAKALSLFCFLTSSAWPQQPAPPSPPGSASPGQKELHFPDVAVGILHSSRQNPTGKPNWQELGPAAGSISADPSALLLLEFDPSINLDAKLLEKCPLDEIDAFRVNFSGNVSLGIVERLGTSKKCRSLEFDFSRLGEDALSGLAKCQNLENLSLKGRRISKTNFSTIGALPHLARLDLTDCDFSEEEFSGLGNPLSLQHFDLSNTSISDASLAKLQGLTGLRSLSFRRCKFRGEGLGAIRSLPKLEELDLTLSSVTDEGLASISGMTQLERIDLSETAVTLRISEILATLTSLKSFCVPFILGDEIAEAIGRLPQLETPYCKSPELNYLNSWGGGGPREPANGSISDRGLALLNKNKNLEYLDLAGSRISNDGLKVLKSMTSLRQLSLRGTNVNDSGLAHIEGLENLSSLALARTNVTDRGLPHLRKLKKLKWLELSFALVDDGVSSLVNLPEVQLAEDWRLGPVVAWGSLSDKGLASARYLKSIRSIDLNTYQSKATDEGLRYIGEMTGLQNLRLESYRGGNFSDQGIAYLQNLVNLETLSLRGQQISDAALKSLSRMTKLKSLCLARTAIRGTGLAQLKGLTKLRELDLSDTKIDSSALPSLEFFPYLEELSLSHAQIDSLGLATLARIRGLTRLELQGVPTDASMIPIFGRMKKLRRLNLGPTDEELARQILAALPGVAVGYEYPMRQATPTPAPPPVPIS